MGEGLKVPEKERPLIKMISDQLDNLISRDIQKLFVQDIQNDCRCSIEKYDVEDSKYYTMYLSESGIESTDQQLCLPMLPNISEEDVLSLLKKAGIQSNNKRNYDCALRFMIYNPDSNFEFVLQAYLSCLPHTSSEYKCFKQDSLKSNIVPKEQVWFTPEPEFFGCLSANIDKFGVFCIPNQIYKKSIGNDTHR